MLSAKFTNQLLRLLFSAFVLLSALSCQQKKLETTLSVLEERVVMLEASLKANKDLLVQIAENTKTSTETTPLSFSPFNDSTNDSTMANANEGELESSMELVDESAGSGVETLEPMDESPAQPMSEGISAEMIPEISAGMVPKTYERALKAYFAGQLDEARVGFKQILSSQKEHTLASNANYWLGEVAYSKANYNQALVLFQQVLDNYPKSNKSPDALLKIGKCHEQLGEDDAAISNYRRLMAEFPKSESAALARSWF